MKWQLSLAERVWRRKGFTGKLLWIMALPASFLYSLGVRVRNLLYRAGLLPSRSLPCPVVSVGNLTVGGTGKTPTAIWLALEMEKLGYRAVILSRGYRRRRSLFSRRAAGKLAAAVKDPHDPRSVGDESAMMARWFGQKVGVGKIRYEAAKRLLDEGKTDVFILDDGFQHRRLRRDLDLLLLGSDWNGWVMPAGPFREPRGALARAHLLVITGSQERWEPWIEEHRKRGAIFYGSLEPQGLLTMDRDQAREKPLALLAGKKIVAVSAIANPLPFYRMIHDWEGEIVDTIEFPDHYEYSTEDWRRINNAARQGDLIVTTEKDLIKLVQFPFARERLFALRVSMVIREADSLVRMVQQVILKKGTGHPAPGREGHS